MFEILDPTPDDVAREISDNLTRATAVRREDFAIVHQGGGEMIAGVTASVSFAILFVNNLWVADAHRRVGIGTQLMRAAEDEGRRRGARSACVDTLSSQAPGFYAELGYEEFGRLSGEVGGAPLDRIWLRKTL